MHICPASVRAPSPSSSTEDSQSWHGIEAHSPSKTHCLLDNFTAVTFQRPSTNLLPPGVAPFHSQDPLPQNPSGIILDPNRILLLPGLPSPSSSFTSPQRPLKSTGYPVDPYQGTCIDRTRSLQDSHKEPQASAEEQTHRIPRPPDFPAGAVSGAPLLGGEGGAISCLETLHWEPELSK